MNKNISNELIILWSDFEENDVEAKLEAFYRIKSVASANDLPQLLKALESSKNDFWTRELLAEPICEMGGAKYLPELFEALQKNFDDGHDNDTFCHFLVEITYAEPLQCKEKLEELIAMPNFNHKDHAVWLLEYCK